MIERGYSRLLSTVELGSRTIRNRVVFSAHLTNFAVNGLPTAQHAAYYEARARGGAGLIITEEHTVHPSDRPYEKLIEGYRPEVVDGYRTITAAAHKHGAVILAQLNHNGAQGSSMHTGRPLWAPSAVPDPMFREVPKALTQAEIDQLIAGYAKVAEHCRQGGFDGVELQASQASLIRGFLAPGTNLRTDEYGGLLENRARFLIETLAAIRAALGPDLILGVRLAGEERVAGGIEMGEALEVAQMVERHVDYVNTSIGLATSTLHLIEASMATPRGYAMHIPTAFKEVLQVPVIGVGRFTDPAAAEKALATGQCDLVGVVRGQIADPDFAQKAMDGNKIRQTCLACNQECIGRVGFNRAIGCVVNPRTGHEATALPTPALRGKSVIVVGGGPAGMQAAAVAAERGHRVTLMERSGALGGQIAEAARAPYRTDLTLLTRDLAARCRAASVQLQLEATATAADLAADVVVIATGARPIRPAWAGQGYCDVRDVLGDRVRPTGKVLVIDGLGFHPGTSVAELLAERGCDVTICTDGMVVGQDLGVTLDREGWLMRAHGLGITQLTDRVVIGSDDEGVAMLHHSIGEVAVEHWDWIVGAGQQAPEDALWRELKGSGRELHRIGDALAPRRAHAAIIEGQRVGEAL
ncbi:mycofactocin system FadH/OYE family oxidoreductase 2 [Tomitella biformata]|uniref:mycofactocin system FadH/OYE family oxidoreductase 2 n=1 Tax=Tomitella biformata TaxID=630403 RepID=UPI000466B5FF|nr:mycofactocin system FadH/OYE family oxidoreductase 2 [Tomitella biformata]